MDVLLDRYEVLGQLGSGGMAEILRVRDRAVPGRVVALKRQRAASDLTELLAEFRVLAQVQHPNLPAVFDFHPDLGAGQPGYTLEEVAGQTADRVADRLGPPAVADIAAGLLRALAYIHARGLIHGDLHPHNLMVREPEGWTPDGATPLEVKVLDLAPGLPRSGGMGALPFLAPERLEGAPPTPASDLFAVGVTLHRLITGRLPFPDYPHLPADRRPVGAAELGALKPLVLDLLDPRADQRPNQAASVLARLARALDRPLPALTPAIVRSTLMHGPTQPVSDWPRRLVETAGQELLGRGASGVIVLRGALGSGRSRALRELRWTLQAQPGTLVLHTAAAANDPPAAAIRRLLTQAPPAERSALPDELSDTVDDLLQTGALAPEADRDPEKARARAIDHLARALLSLSRRRRLAVLVDDADEADAVSRDVVLAMARYVAHRPEEVDSLALVVSGAPGPHLDGLSTPGHPAVVEMSPPNFDHAAVAGLLGTAFLGRTPSHRLVQAVLQVTGGSPLVTSEAVAAAFEQGWVALVDDAVNLAAQAPQPLPVPRSAADALAARLEGLTREDPRRLQLLALLAAAPVPVPVGLVGPALDLPASQVGPLLDRLRGAGVVHRQVDDGVTRLSLATPALHDRLASHAELPAVWARLARVAPGDDLASRVLVAVATREVGVPNDALITDVAQELVGRGMARETVALLAPGAPTPGAAQALGDAHALLGHDDQALQAWAQLPPREAARAAGSLLIRRGRYREAVDKLLEALGADATRAESADDAEVHCLLARAHMLQSRYDDALAHCERARPQATPRLRPRLHYIEGLVQFYRGSYAEATARFEAALGDWRRAGMLIEQAEVVTALGLVHYRQSELGPALDRFEETLTLAARCGDRDRTLITLMNIAVIHQARGEWGLAESRYTEALSMARVLGHRTGEMKVTQNLGNLYRYLGRLDDAATHLAGSLELSLAEGNRYIECHNRTLLGEVAWLQDRLDDAVVELRRALSGFTEVGSVSEAADCERSLAQVMLSRGDLTTAASHAEAALRRGAETKLPRVEALALVTLGEIARRSGAPLADLIGRLEPMARKLEELQRPEELWQVQLGLHRLYRAQGQAQPAREAGLAALATLQEMAGRLPEDRRDVFLALPNRREALAELRWLTALSGATGGEEPKGRLSRLLDVNQRLNEELDLSKLLEYIIDSAILLTGAERGFVLMLDPDKEGEAALKVVVARNIDQENIKNRRFKVSYSIAQRVIEAGEAVLTTDAMGDDRYRQYLSIHHLKLRSVLCLPMIRAGRVLGALYIDNRFQKSAFTDDDLHFMEAFANQAAIALTNAQILEERQTALDELARSQAKVEELNARLREQLAEKERALKETEQMLVVQRQQLTHAHSYESIVGSSPALRGVFHILDRVCESDIPVLITGESGTGKELVARAVHYNGQRKDRPFVAINCSSIPETLIESELFGHVRGAFTGATADKKGVFEVANRGTLLLDEIGEMPIEMQAKLLRALQEGEIQKVGSPRSINVDVRVVAATNRNLRDMIKAKTFREDLYYRLAVVTLELPPLRNRVEDIPILVEHFLEKNRRDGLAAIEQVTPEAMRLLMRYAWPGNVRELETVIKNASIFAEGNALVPQDFSNFPNILGKEGGKAPAPRTRAVRPLEELEREAIIHALEVNGGNKKRTAEQLGIDRRTLYNKLAAYGISVERRAHVLGRNR